MTNQTRKSLRSMILLSAVVSLFACSDNDNVATTTAPPPPPPAMASFNVTVENLTNAQPLSPIAVIAHQSGYEVFTVGSAASVSLEEMAEGGDNTALLAEADADVMVVATTSGGAPIGPAGRETVSIDLPDSDRVGLRLSIATMLVNTNDAFTSLNTAVDTMAVGDVLTFNSVAYDAGTEADTEMATDIPGPAGGGTGFDAARNDQADRVLMHSGIVSKDDGLATSDLTEQHRFDNPVARISIERIN
jgi:hypothetical protein